MTPDLSFVVVTWNSEEDLAELIESMSSHLSDPERIELVVVDNASSTDPTPIAQRWEGSVICRRLDSNIGFGGAVNLGIGLATAPVCVICNPDVRLVDDSLEALARVALARQALVGPRLIWSDGSLQPSASGPVVGVWPWIGALIPGAIQPGWMLRRTEPWRLEGTIEVTWLTGAVIAAPTALLRDLGPFDESIELMYEDLDLCLRAARRSIQSLFAPEVAMAIHIGGTAREKRFADDGLALAQGNRREVIERSFGVGAAGRSTAALKLNLLLRSALKRILGRSSSPERAELSAIRRASGSRRSG